MALTAEQRIRRFIWYLGLIDSNADGIQSPVGEEFLAWWNTIAQAKRNALTDLIDARHLAMRQAKAAAILAEE